MYRKQADRLIVRDVKRRLAGMERPDWLRAVMASQAANPDWFRFHQGDFCQSLERLMAAAGIELSRAESGVHFIGNEFPAGKDTG